MSHDCFGRLCILFFRGYNSLILEKEKCLSIGIAGYEKKFMVNAYA